MRSGTPLTDDDRWPWLAALGRAAAATCGGRCAPPVVLGVARAPHPRPPLPATAPSLRPLRPLWGCRRGLCVASCSALRASYRARLRECLAPNVVDFILLDVPTEELTRAPARFACCDGTALLRGDRMAAR